MDAAKAQSPFDELEAVLLGIDAKRDQQAKVDDDPGYVDLASSLAAMGAILSFLDKCGLNSEALSRLHIALAHLHDGKTPDAMLLPRTPAHAPGDTAGVEILKGGLAGLMELGMELHSSREAAAQWVIRHASTETRRHAAVRPTDLTWRTVAKWRTLFKSVRSEGTRGRTNYLRIVNAGRRAIAGGTRDPRRDLLRLIEGGIVRRLPARP